MLSIGFLLACEKTATKPTDDYLAGKWIEHVPDGKFYFEATLHSFSFKEDSFNAKIISWTDVVVIIPSDSCSSDGSDETYIKGKYSIENDSIYFTGKLCDSLYQNLQPSCYGVSDYIDKFRFAKNDTTIIFNADEESIFGYGIILKKE